MLCSSKVSEESASEIAIKNIFLAKANHKVQMGKKSIIYNVMVTRNPKQNKISKISTNKIR